MRSREVTHALAAPISPGKGLGRGAIADELDAGEQTTLANIADVRVARDAGQVLAEPRDLGLQIREHLARNERRPRVGDVRQRGLLDGIELVRDRA